MGKKYWSFETFKGGLETVWKEYQVIVMRYLWALEEGEPGAGSGKCWEATNLVLRKKGKSISRASCIFFLNAMVDEGVLTYVERTGKGGHHRIYTPAFDETGFEEFLVNKIISRLFKVWPKATRKAIESHKR